MKDLKSFEGLLRAATTKGAFLATCAALKTPDVRIDHDALASYAASLRKPDFISPWSEYLTPGNDLATDFAELTVSTVQQGGYLYEDDKGQVRKWQIGGSGAKALLAKMDQVRAQQNLPGIHLTDAHKARRILSGVFNDAPYGKKRNAIWAELASPSAAEDLRDVFEAAKTPVGGFHFDFSSLKALGRALPLGFGEDPFLKKASLLTILFAGVAHHKLAPDSVTLDVPVPADYRVPQTLHNMGILRFSNDLVNVIESGILLPENDSRVAQIRVQSILAVAEILQNRPDLQIHHIDGELWFAGRLFDSAPGKLDEKKAKIRNSLESHGYRSGFNTPGFKARAGNAVNVATLRF